VTFPPSHWATSISFFCSLFVDTVKWFISRLPSHSKDTLQSQCPPVNISSTETEFFVTLAVVGDLHLSLVDENTIEPQAATFVANISGFLKGADAVITNFASPVLNEGSSTVEILRSDSGRFMSFAFSVCGLLSIN